MSTDIPRDADGRRLCEHCHTKPVPESRGTKPRRYCSRNCVQRAYEARKVREAIVTSVAVAVARDRAKSREVASDGRGTSRDFPKPQVDPLVAPVPDPRRDYQVPPPDAPAAQPELPLPFGGLGLLSSPPPDRQT